MNARVTLPCLLLLTCLLSSSAAAVAPAPSVPASERIAAFIYEPENESFLGIDSPLFLKADGTLWLNGLHHIYWAGEEPSPAMRPNIIMTQVRSFALGPKAVCAVRANGELWGWETTTGFRPQLIDTDVQEAQSSTVSRELCVYLKKDKTLWSWMDPAIQSSGGVLLDGRCPNIPYKQTILRLANVRSFAGGIGRVLAVTYDNVLWAWGVSYSADGYWGVLHETACQPVRRRTNVRIAQPGEFEDFFITMGNRLFRHGSSEEASYAVGTTIYPDDGEVRRGADEEYGKEPTFVLKKDQLRASRVKSIQMKSAYARFTGGHLYAYTTLDSKLYLHNYGLLPWYFSILDLKKAWGRSGKPVRLPKSRMDLEVQLGIYSDINDGITFFVADNVDKYLITKQFILYTKQDGTLWGCGANDNGRLGNGDDKDLTTFTRITLPETPPNPRGILDIAIEKARAEAAEAAEEPAGEEGAAEKEKP